MKGVDVPSAPFFEGSTYKAARPLLECSCFFFLTVEHEAKGDGQLVEGLAENVLGHGPRDERLRPPVRLPQQELCGRHLGS